MTHSRTLWVMLLLAAALAGTANAAYYYHPVYAQPVYTYPAYNDYQGPYYRSSTVYSDGRNYASDTSISGNGFSHHTSVVINEGPYRCIGNGCGAAYYIDHGNSYGYGGYGYNEYYNSKHHPYYWDPAVCTGYWRGGCEHVHVGGVSNNYYQDYYNNW